MIGHASEIRNIVGFDNVNIFVVIYRARVKWQTETKQRQIGLPNILLSRPHRPDLSFLMLAQRSSPIIKSARRGHRSPLALQLFFFVGGRRHNGTT